MERIVVTARFSLDNNQKTGGNPDPLASSLKKDKCAVDVQVNTVYQVSY